jgi:hypothetical protein
MGNSPVDGRPKFLLCLKITALPIRVPGFWLAQIQSDYLLMKASDIRKYSTSPATKASINTQSVTRESKLCFQTAVKDRPRIRSMILRVTRHPPCCNMEMCGLSSPETATTNSQVPTRQSTRDTCPEVSGTSLIQNENKCGSQQAKFEPCPRSTGQRDFFTTSPKTGVQPGVNLLIRRNTKRRSPTDR